MSRDSSNYHPPHHARLLGSLAKLILPPWPYKRPDDSFVTASVSGAAVMTSAACDF